MNIIFDKPAANWHEGCPLGNGFMGQMLYGGITEERIDLSHLTFFSGSDSIDPYRKDAAEAFYKAREAAAEGNYSEVSAQTERMMGMRGNYGTNLPAGVLKLTFDKVHTTQSYSRTLNIDNGLAAVKINTPSGVQLREAFSSHSDQVFALYLDDNSEDGFSGLLSFDGGRCPYHTDTQDDRLYFDIQALEKVHSDGTEGVCLSGVVKVCVSDGHFHAEPSGIRFSNVHQAVLYLAMSTDFSLKIGCKAGFDQINRKELRQKTEYSLADYETLKRRHCEDILSHMNKMKLSLGVSEENIPAAALVEQVCKGSDNRYLTELMVAYGRYLLLSSSREDSPLPTPLQGIWNDDVACQIGWTCDMHLDINTQMNYWLSEPGRLSECHTPLFRWMEERLIPYGRQTAKHCYGLDGWVGELVSNAWGYAAPYWNKALSPCPTGGIWQASDYMEHYRHGQDTAFLREHALPVIEEAVTFFIDYIFEDENGYLTSGPSISPENIFLVDGKKQYASNGCTYEILMIRELFLEYQELCHELSVSSELLNRVEKALPRLLPYRIMDDGTLAEWTHDYISADLQHRHTSHLLGLFPYAQITPEQTPDLAAAAAASIFAKLTPYENWEDTGWARSLLVLYSARLWNSGETARHLRAMQTILTGPNLMVMHPPTRGTGTDLPVYELDGNTGFAMGVLESLVQSHDGCIRLLPALPPEWKNGCLKGVCVRGGILLDFIWKDGKVTELWAEAQKECAGIFVFNRTSTAVKLTAGRQRIR